MQDTTTDRHAHAIRLGYLVRERYDGRYDVIADTLAPVRAGFDSRKSAWDWAEEQARMGVSAAQASDD